MFRITDHACVAIKMECSLPFQFTCKFHKSAERYSNESCHKNKNKMPEEVSEGNKHPDLGNDIHINSNNNRFIYKTSGSSSLSNEKKLCRKCGSSTRGLHHFNCLPTHLRFNPFVRTGYRLNLTTSQCLKSLFYFHNETINIYTHGLAGIFFILITPYIYWDTTMSKLHLYSVHHITSIICVLCSAIYHLMMCHSNGDSVYQKLIQLDMVGVWLTTTFGFIGFIKATFFCFPSLYKLLLLLYSLTAYISFVYIMKGRNAVERLSPLIPICCIKFLFYTSRSYMAWNGHITAYVGAVWYFLAMEFFGVLGGIINTSRFPEKWLDGKLDGKLDYLFNSHNIMHIVVLACPVLLHCGTVLDFKWMETAVCPAY